MPPLSEFLMRFVDHLANRFTTKSQLCHSEERRPQRVVVADDNKLGCPVNFGPRHAGRCNDTGCLLSTTTSSDAHGVVLADDRASR